MNILHLRYAVEVEKTGSITQAADNLYMGQPNLSKAIKDLEASIGISIFKRSSKGVVPTKKGKEFLSYSKNILSQIDEMESRYKPEEQGKHSLKISVPRASYITHAFSRFFNMLDDTKEIEINFREANSMKAINNVIEGESSIGIIRYQTAQEKYFLKLLNEKDIAFEELWEFEYLVLMSKEHPLAFSRELPRQELSKYIEIVHGDFSAQLEQEEHTGRRICIYECGSQFDLLRQIPAAYMWDSPIPEELLDMYNLVHRKCDGASSKYKDLLIRSKKYKLSDADECFIKELYKVKDELAS